MFVLKISGIQNKSESKIYIFLFFVHTIEFKKSFFYSKFTLIMNIYKLLLSKRLIYIYKTNLFLLTIGQTLNKIVIKGHNTICIYSINNIICKPPDNIDYRLNGKVVIISGYQLSLNLS